MKKADSLQLTVKPMSSVTTTPGLSNVKLRVCYTSGMFITVIYLNTSAILNAVKCNIL